MVNKRPLKYHLILGFSFCFIILFLQSCIREPQKNISVYNFNPNKGWLNNDTIKLDLDLKDSINTFSLYLMGEIKYNRNINSLNGYPINILFIAPNSEVFEDRITLPLRIINAPNVKKISNGIMNIEWPYRKNILNPLSGRWKIFITKQNSNIDYSNLISLGIRCKID